MIAFFIVLFIVDFFAASFHASQLARFQARIERLEREVYK